MVAGPQSFARDLQSANNNGQLYDCVCFEIVSRLGHLGKAGGQGVRFIS
eukprot:COSAG03_NODE_21428_length_304_cov_0.760976_2_plen_48_part_01